MANTKTTTFPGSVYQVTQARNMSIGEHRHCCVTFEIQAGFVWGKTYRFCNLRNERISIKKQFTLHKICVTPLLCGPWAELWPFDGFFCKRTMITKSRKPIPLIPIKWP